MPSVSNVVTFKAEGGTVYNSAADFGLTLEGFDAQKPGGKWNYADVPGAAGSLDLSRALSQDVPPEDRVLTLKFGVSTDTHARAVASVDSFTAAVHLQKMLIQTPDDAPAGLWYSGNVEVERVEYVGTGAHIDVKAVCEPYRYSATGGSLTLARSTKHTYSGAGVYDLGVSILDTPAAGFTFEVANSIWQPVPALAVECASTANLLDLDFAAIRGVTCKTGGAWQRSNNVSQVGQTLDFGGVNLQWVERATVCATNATANISNVRLPFTTNSHLYVFVESSAITAKGSVTVDGSSRAAGVRVRVHTNIGGNIGADGLPSQLGTTIGAELSAPAVGNSISTMLDCGAVDSQLGMIEIDVCGITAASFTAKVMLVKSGVAVSGWVEPNVSFARTTLASPLERTATAFDSYTCVPTGGGVYKFAQLETVPSAPITGWQRNAKYIEFAALDFSGWVMQYPLFDVVINVYETNSATIDAGAMPAYPVATITDAAGAVVTYNGTEHLLAQGVSELPTLLNRGSNTIEWSTFNTSQSAGVLRWSKGVI